MAQKHGSSNAHKEGTEEVAHGSSHRRLERGHVAIQAQEKALNMNHTNVFKAIMIY